MIARARRASDPADRRVALDPLPPRRKWRAILIATLLLAPGLWSIVIGLVAGASDEPNAPAAGPFVAFGLAIIPFVFVALAFLSEHPRAPAAVVKALAVSIVVGIPLSALAGDAVTGLVAGIGAGGAVALRADVGHTGRSRAIAVLLASLYVFLMVRVAPEAALFAAPVLPFSSIGVADHLRERRREPA
jgi:hypothetical protein